MKLFVGLGNPGSEYARHRHNAGFMVLDRIAERHRLPPWRRKFDGEATEGDLGGERVLLLKPLTYMNESGRSVGAAARFHKIALSDIVVFHDELDLAPGKIKVKAGGGNAGHNGLRSISQHLGNDYVRVRIGIGHPGAKELVHGWVLHDFSRAEQAGLEPLLDAMADAAGRLAGGDLARFQTDVARALAPPRAEAPQTASPVSEPRPPKPRTAGHPAGERMGKREGAFAATLEKWLKAQRKDE